MQRRPIAGKGADILSWLLRRRERLARIEAEAEALIRDLGVEAYAESRRREREANDLAAQRLWGRTASAIARKIGERTGLDAATASGRDADFSALIETFKAQTPRRGSAQPAASPETLTWLAPEAMGARDATPLTGGARSLQDGLKQAFKPEGGG